jgi:hypothetical protein
VVRHDDVRALESTAGRRQSPQQRYADCEGGIGNDAKWSPRQSDVAAVGLNHHDAVIDELLSKFLRTGGMELEGDDPSATAQQWPRQRAGAGSNIEHQVAATDAGAVHEPFGPRTIEAMPPPTCPLPGHGRPS